MLDRLTDIEKVYAIFKDNKDFSDSVFILTLEKSIAISSKIKSSFYNYFRGTLLKNIKEKAVSRENITSHGEHNQNRLPEWIQRQIENQQEEHFVENLVSEEKRKEADRLLRALEEIK